MLDEFGKRFSFPENIEFSYDGKTGDIVNEIAVRMVEKYDNFVVQQIANEARAAGIADLTVLNKPAILRALQHAQSSWGYKKGKLCCLACGFHPEYSLYARYGFSNSNFCPNCGAQMKN